MPDHTDTPSIWERETFLKLYDLVVIGAGIVGLSTALFYQEKNPERRVAVLERGLLPNGASTRNAGFACVGSVGEHLADLEKESEENIRKRIKKRYMGLQLLRETLGDEAIGYEPCGGYELFTSKTASQKAETGIEKMNRWMEEEIGEKNVYRRSRLNGYPVIANRLEGALHAGKMMQSLIRKAQAAGVTVFWGSKVQKIEQHEQKVLLDTDIRFGYKKLVVAMNGFTRSLLPEIPVEPARGYVFVTNPLPDLKWRGTFHHDRGYVYFRNLGDRLLLGGARNVVEEEEQTDRFGVNPRIKKHLVHFAETVLKIDRDWRIDCEWSGIMGFSPTKTPVVKTLDSGIIVAVGLSGMGVAIGMQVGRQAAGMVSSG